MHSGATRLHVIIGDPVAQTKSPAGITAAFAARGVDAICVAIEAAPDDFDAVIGALARMRNVDGLIITVPHKLAALRHCGRTTERARRTGAVNVMRREASGWFGDMTDGGAVVAALRAQGCELHGQRALVVGAGGAGSATAVALAQSGVAEIAISDLDSARRDTLVEKLRGITIARAGAADPAGFGVVVNATPVGLHADDAALVDVARLDAGTFIADLVTSAGDTRLIAAGRRSGCRCASGEDIFLAQRDILADFLLART